MAAETAWGATNLYSLCRTGDAAEQVRAGQEEDTAAAGAKEIQALRILKGVPPWRRSVRSTSLESSRQPAPECWLGCYVDRALHSIFDRKCCIVGQLYYAS